MKQYQVNFYPTNALVEAETEDEAEQLALELFFMGELNPEIESIEELGIVEED